jgi:hypothetical protein
VVTDSGFKGIAAERGEKKERKKRRQWLCKGLGLKSEGRRRRKGRGEAGRAAGRRGTRQGMSKNMKRNERRREKRNQVDETRREREREEMASACQ